MSYILLLCQITLSFILFVASSGKLFYPQQFFASIEVSGVPRYFVLPAVLTTISVELELALSLLFSTAQSLIVSFVGTFLLLGVFTVWMFSVSVHHVDIKCGCFGISYAKVGIKSIIRNLLFMGMAAVGFVIALSTPSILPSPSLWTSIIAAMLMIGVIVRYETTSLGALRHLWR